MAKIKERDLETRLSGEQLLAEYRKWKEEFLTSSSPELLMNELPSLTRKLADALNDSLAREALLLRKLS